METEFQLLDRFKSILIQARGDEASNEHEIENDFIDIECSSIVLEPSSTPPSDTEMLKIVKHLNKLAKQCNPNNMPVLSQQIKLKRVLLFIHCFDDRLSEFLSSAEFHRFFARGTLHTEALLVHISYYYSNFQIGHSDTVPPFYLNIDVYQSKSTSL